MEHSFGRRLEGFAGASWRSNPSGWAFERGRNFLVPPFGHPFCYPRPSRLAQNPFSSLSSRFFWPKSTYCLRICSRSDLTRLSQNWSFNLEAKWKPSRKHFPFLCWRRPPAKKPGFTFIWLRKIQADYHGHGKSPFANWHYSEKFWQIWNRIMKFLICFFLASVSAQETITIPSLEQITTQEELTVSSIKLELFFDLFSAESWKCKQNLRHQNSVFSFC